MIRRNLEISEFDQDERLYKITEMDRYAPCCDLHGMRSDEAVDECERFIEDEYYNNSKSVRIVHGRGKGILRKKVHELLKKNQYVRNFRDSHNPEEMLGATIVLLKEDL